MHEADIIAQARQSSVAVQNLIGDDCAVLPLNDTHILLVTTDAFYEGVHFLRDAITPAELAYKALAANLSDLAAMGSDAHGASAFLTLCLPADLPTDWPPEFWAGWRQLAEATGITLAGGDTVQAAGPLVISITLMIPCLKTQVKHRAAAQAGDIIAVTGTLGDSLAGLQQLLNQQRDLPKLIKRHHTPPIRLSEAAWLGAQPAIRGMMDLSDGLRRDLPKLCAEAQCGAIITVEQLPISMALHEYATKQQISAVDLAYSGGEDYELLCTIAPNMWPYIQQQFQNAFQQTPLTAIGQIAAEADIMLINQGLPYHAVVDYGFDHFCAS